MGPLVGLRVVELAGVGPAPMCAMLLADLGATVLRIDRAVPAVDFGNSPPLKFDLLLRSRKSIGLDLKQPHAVELALKLVSRADALIEGFRPGVAERLGLSPDVCLERNPRLVYGRMTGWGQSGPLAKVAGHDINYIALSGALHAIGRAGQPPTPPLNLVGDFGGGALYLAFGVLAAVLEARQSGKGQVVDAAMIDGSISLLTSYLGRVAAGMLTLERGANAIDSGAHFYEVYECLDGRWIAIGAIEYRFHSNLLRHLEIDPEEIGDHRNPANWPKGRALLAAKFKTKTRDDWCELLETADVCVSPVLSADEAPQHPHIRARGSFIELDGIMQPAPAPRFSRTVPAAPTQQQPITRENTIEALRCWLEPQEIETQVAAGIL